MKSAKKEQTKCLSSVELSKSDEEGAFNCPSCGNIISPDDTTEKAYSILEVKVNTSGFEELVIYCKKCGSQINLAGFPSNAQNSMANKKIVSNNAHYVAHI